MWVGATLRMLDHTFYLLFALVLPPHVPAQRQMNESSYTSLNKHNQ